MTTKYTYTMKFDPQKIADMIMDRLGKEAEVGVSGNRQISFTFTDVDLTPAQRDGIKAALPAFVQLFYSFDRTISEVPDEV